MNFCQSDIPGASLNRRLPAYETYRPRFDVTREALCIACIGLPFSFLSSINVHIIYKCHFIDEYITGEYRQPSFVNFKCVFQI